MSTFFLLIRAYELPRVTPLVYLLRAFIFVAAISSIATSVRAQGVEARAASVSGRAVVTRTASPASTLRSGQQLAPGDVIDTSAGARVRIELSDGSVVIVQPGTRLVLQDYNTAGSLRELLKIFIGRVRIKINNFGSRANPYRVNSPSASIGVRGTEFGVSVAAGGETEVIVYEGLVEVTSLYSPQDRVTVGPGRGVIVRPNEPIQFLMPGPEKEIGERVENPGNNAAGRSVTVDNPATTASGLYERYIDSIVDSGQNALPSRFAAFPDTHLDSLENPAFATEFSAPEGRIFLLPSFARTRGSRERTLFGFGEPRPFDHSLSPQASFFLPLKHRSVVGGRIAFSRNRIQSFSLDENLGVTVLPSPGTPGTAASAGSTDHTFVEATVLASRRFGSDGRTSIGVGLDFLSQRGSLLNLTTQTDDTGLTQRELVEARSRVNRTRLTIGLARDVGAASKLGLYYRYGYISANDRNRSHTLDGDPLPLQDTSVTGRSSEIGIRLRGPITRRLFYGAEGNFLRANGSENIRPAADANESSRASRAVLGFGLGYALRPRTLLAFDLAGGWSRARILRREDATGNVLEDERQAARFVSLHAALQTDVWRRLFVSGSIVALRQSRTIDLGFFPNRFGQRLTAEGVPAVGSLSHDKFTDYFSNFGMGWRFTPNFLAQYIVSTDFGKTSPRHTLVLRYTFTIGDK